MFIRNEEDEEFSAASEAEGDATPDVDEEASEEDEEEIDWKAKAEESEQARIKAEEIAENQRIRAEKAEKKGKPSATAAATPEPTADNSISQLDLMALMQAQVHVEDVSEVTDYAKLKGISVQDALKTSVVKTILSERKELRTTAEATSTGVAKRGSGKISDETLLKNAEKGIMPDSQEDLDRLIRARKGLK